MPARSFSIIRDGDNDPTFFPPEPDDRPIRAYLVDGIEVTQTEYEAAHEEWHTP